LSKKRNKHKQRTRQASTIT